ncbi:hypothetical protein ONZ45_g5407 [Pleurotus djamor]|nr:hypothetical protein ONZ45_g5407 [Pleurotus djamor]
MSLRDHQDLIRSLTLIRASTYVPVASAGLFLYDYSITLYDEVRLVWRSAWSLGKVLFFLTRYPAFVDIGMTVYHNVTHEIPTETCALLYQVTGWMFICGMIIAEIIMVIRVWALWSRSRVIGIILFVASIVGAVVTAISFSRFDTHQSFLNVSEIAPQLSGCYPDPGNNAVFIGYLMLMAFEAVVMVLLLIKGVQDFRQVTLSGFLYTFYQDGIMYYALLLLISISNVVVLLSGPVSARVRQLLDNVISPNPSLPGSKLIAAQPPTDTSFLAFRSGVAPPTH